MYIFNTIKHEYPGPLNDIGALLFYLDESAPLSNEFVTVLNANICYFLFKILLLGLY